MSDRELLEFAAKAAGYDFAWYCLGQNNPNGKPTIPCVNGSAWNPLTDDGDALRLAIGMGLVHGEPVRIRLEFQNDGEQDYTVVEGSHGETTHHHTEDAYEATRRAIVRAAAKIGANQ